MAARGKKLKDCIINIAIKGIMIINANRHGFCRKQDILTKSPKFVDDVASETALPSLGHLTFYCRLNSAGNSALPDMKD